MKGSKGDVLTSAIATVLIILIGVLIIRFIGFSAIQKQQTNEITVNFLGMFQGFADTITYGLGIILLVLIILYIIKKYLKKPSAAPQSGATQSEAGQLSEPPKIASYIRITPVLFIIILLTAGVNASAIDITAPKQIQIYAGYSASEKIILKNTGNYSDWFSLSTTGLLSNIMNFRLNGTNINSVFLNAGESKEIELSIEPSKDIEPGYYLQSIIASSQKDRAEVQTTIILGTKSPVYVSELAMSCTVCRDSITISGKIKNVLSTDFSGKIKYIIVGSSYEESMDIPKASVKEFSKTFSLSGAKAGEYVIAVEILDNSGAVSDRYSRSFSIQKIENIVIEYVNTSFFIGEVKNIKATNKGNAESEAKIYIAPANQWYAIYNGPAPSTAGQAWLIKSSMLQPNESINVRYYVIYWPNIVIVFVLLFVLWYAYREYFTIQLRKTVIEKMLADGGKEISVSILLRSRIKRIENAVVKDVLPSSFSLTGEFHSLKPVIRKTDHGTELTWRIGLLMPDEERILHYKFRLSSTISGQIRLPRAYMSGKVENKSIKILSNSLSISGTPQSEIKTVSVKVAK